MSIRILLTKNKNLFQMFFQQARGLWQLAASCNFNLEYIHQHWISFRKAFWFGKSCTFFGSVRLLDEFSPVLIEKRRWAKYVDFWKTRISTLFGLTANYEKMCLVDESGRHSRRPMTWVRFLFARFFYNLHVVHINTLRIMGWMIWGD